MADATETAGLDEPGFEAMLESIASDPEQAFADLRSLLFDATRALFGAASVEEASAVLAGFDDHRFATLLHRYELSNWVLYARAYGSATPDDRARAVDRRLREDLPLEWLIAEWLTPALKT